MVSSSLKLELVVASRSVGSAARLPSTEGRRDRECSGVADLRARSGQGDRRGACVGADREGDRLVCACGPHQGANR